MHQVIFPLFPYLPLKPHPPFEQHIVILNHCPPKLNMPVDNLIPYLDHRPQFLRLENRASHLLHCLSIFAL
ncbi:hypothetical protein CC80DRAFT_164823 [Byssothecium circinans]|uniref:Uncharacterized protein n=1 Tax=Byssothecium circinans TaxID=147558 RepID=A0A6A5TVQ0_9PLEO|nr:hypothetical protein CC80DRAFT_164823 [Byssothecium circinans]